MTSTNNPTIYAIVGNIPGDYHSCDLRNYFSQFIETGGFECFHFRHRPEEKRLKNSHPQSDKAKCSAKSKDTGCFKVPIGVPKTSSKNVSSGSQSWKATSKTLCCIIKLKEDCLIRLLQMYHRKHWLDRNGDSIPPLCMISRIKISDEKGDGEKKYKTRGELKKIPEDRETFTRFDLLSIAELFPPDIMPNGNVGTPTKHFLDLIQKCKLPPKIIKRLGLTFPKTRSRRVYGSVDFNYGGPVVHTSDEEETVNSASGKEIEAEGDRSEPIVFEEEVNEEKTEEVDSEEDDDGCEDWERHESLNDDPANIERNKERLYEEEMEVTWEKGGPGIVWYTDASFWKEKEGDFDEQTSDDWDIDTSIYYDSLAGDKDSRDYVQMRLHQRRREGLEDTQDMFSGIGKFEKHSRGIGRKVMETQGWKEGEGLGSSVEGIADALAGDGQGPSDKRGFGYHGEKVNRYGGTKQPRKDDQFFVSTVYDNPKSTDPKDELLRRKNPNKMTFRSPVNFIKGPNMKSD